LVDLLRAPEALGAADRDLAFFASPGGGREPRPEFERLRSSTNSLMSALRAEPPMRSFNAQVYCAV
jgi:hypothetical protein